MPHTSYRTAPLASTTMPPGIPYIVSNEAAERFSFYGMRGILTVFMTKYLVDSSGALDVMSESEARKYFHLFVASAYLFPFIGAIIADAFLGKYRTIIYLSIVYCLGHACLAIDETRFWLFSGLTLIAVGSGGIKSCVSAHVGDQFGATNQHLLGRVFSWFYLSINLGATASMLITPILLREFGPQVAFGVPGVIMLLATIVFWSGRNKFVHIPPGGREFLRETFSYEGLGVAARVSIVFLFITVFWSIFDQTGSAWVLQAEKMDRYLLGREWEPSQIQAVNSILVLMFIPLFTYAVYPFLGRFFEVTPLRKISIGLFLLVAAASIPVYIEMRFIAKDPPNIAWQLLAYVLITAAEIMVSITALEFAYTQGPKKMKSLVMGIFLLSIWLGNMFVSVLNEFNELSNGETYMTELQYQQLFAGLAIVSAVLFVFVAMLYKGKTYIQDETAE